MIKATTPKRRKGFTLVEVLMASIIISVALLGVYSLFQQAIDMEAKMRLSMYHRDRAEEVVDYFADALERCINLKDVETVRSGGSEQGAFLEFTAVNKGFWVRQCVVRQRITWQQTQTQKGYTVQRQAMMYAGITNVTFANESQVEWDSLSTTELFSQVDALEIEFKETDQPSGGWRKEYNGPGGQIAIRIQAASGDRKAQRIIVPTVQAVLE
jgi:prepilin-type N-terminal cleavage/methylation domain-containing protein